jgi:hypothetical protein
MARALALDPNATIQLMSPKSYVNNTLATYRTACNDQRSKVTIVAIDTCTKTIEWLNKQLKTTMSVRQKHIL